MGSACGDRLDEPLHSVRTFPLHLIRHMAVHIQRKRGGGVAQITLHCLDVVSGADRGNCVGVTQIVETGVGTTNGRNNALVLAVDRRLRQVCPELVGKD